MACQNIDRLIFLSWHLLFLERNYRDAITKHKDLKKLKLYASTPIHMTTLFTT